MGIGHNLKKLGFEARFVPGACGFSYYTREANESFWQAKELMRGEWKSQEDKLHWILPWRWLPTVESVLAPATSLAVGRWTLQLHLAAQRWPESEGGDHLSQRGPIGQYENLRGGVWGWEIPQGIISH